MIKEINILGVVYRVNEVDVVDKEEFCKGKINYLTNEIRIDKGLVQSDKEQTLMREILHAVFDLLGLDELNADESKVQGIATALHHVFTSQTIFSCRSQDDLSSPCEKMMAAFKEAMRQAGESKADIFSDLSVAEKAPDDVERLKNLLFDFIERTCTQPSTTKETEVLPQMADILIKLILP